MDSSPSHRSHITCNFCYEICENPQCLKCLHYYCYACVQRLKKGNKIQCPDCRETSFMREVKKHFTIQKMIDEYNRQLKSVDDTEVGLSSPTVCDVCQNIGKPAKSFCEACEEFLCTDCQTAHKGNKATKNHKLVDFQHLYEEKQRDINKEMKKLQDTKIDLHEKAASTKSLLKQIEESEVEVIEEINKHRKVVLNSVDQHHNQLIEEVKSINKRLQDTLKETEKMLEHCEKKLEAKVCFLSQVSESQDYSLMMDTLSNLSQQIEKDLQQIHFELPEVTPDVLSTISVFKGEDFNPQKSTQINVTHFTEEHTRGLTSQAMVQQIHKKINQSYKQVKCVDIDYTPQKLCVCNDVLWVGSYNKGVFLYNLELNLIKHIEHPQLHNVRSVVKTPTGVIVCDRDTGVHHLNHQGEYTNLICAGCYSDACLTGANQIYALAWKQGEIHTFVRNQNTWEKDTQFKLVKYTDGGTDDKLCTTSTHVYVSSWNTPCVLVYTLSGEYVYKTGGRGGEVGKFNRPLLSDVDSGGKLVVCDWGNYRLQVFDTQTREWTKISGLEGVKYPVCAGVGDKHLWLGTGYPDPTLIKYKVVL